MPDIEHSTLSGAEIHEPKGIAGATANEVYRADGLGSGSWVTTYTLGWEDFNDTGSSQSLTSGSFVDLTNDGAGAFTNTSYQIPGYGPIWNTTSNQFEWAQGGLNLGDVAEIRIDLDITTSGVNDEVSVGLDMAHGHANEYQLKFFENSFKTASTYSNVIIYARVYMGDSATLDNPAKVVCSTDNTGNSVVVNGWFTTYTPRLIQRA